MNEIIDFWPQVFLELASGVPFAVVLGVLVFLSKSLVTNHFQKDLEQYKSELKSQHDLAVVKLSQEHQQALAELQGKLDLARAEREIRLTTLHDLQTTALNETYSVLLNMFGILEVTTGIQQRDDRDERLAKIQPFYAEFVSLNQVFSKRRLLVSQELAEQTRGVILKMVHMADHIRTRPTGRSYEQDQEMKQGIKTALDELMQEYRKVLGVA